MVKQSLMPLMSRFGNHAASMRAEYVQHGFLVWEAAGAGAAGGPG